MTRVTIRVPPCWPLGHLSPRRDCTNGKTLHGLAGWWGWRSCAKPRRVFEPSPATAPPQAAGLLPIGIAQRTGIRHAQGLQRLDVDLRAWSARQMGWILRPFIGAPSEPFEWFRERQSNFFVVVWESFLRLF